MKPALVALALALAACGGNPCKPPFNPERPPCEANTTIDNVAPYCDGPGPNQDMCRQTFNSPKTMGCLVCKRAGDFTDACIYIDGDAYCVHDCGGC